ncbi:MAG: hypothetical protein HYT77_00090 [Deltaproteobacteria bacterium]|nr:hypothetical protein [Deltaproteobacteria bacterium]
MGGSNGVRPVLFNPLTVDGFNAAQEEFELEAFREASCEAQWRFSQDLEDSRVRVLDLPGNSGEKPDGMVDHNDLFGDPGMFANDQPTFLDGKEKIALLNRTCSRFAEKSPLTQTAEAQTALREAGAEKWTGRYNPERRGCEYTPDVPTKLGRKKD